MRTFKVGNFLTLEGSSIAIVQPSSKKLEITGFTSVRLRDGTTPHDVLIECSDGGAGPEDGKCRLKVERFTGIPSSGAIELEDGREAELYLRWPAPISPRNEGLWFLLEFERAGGRYFLNTTYGTDSGMYLRDTNVHKDKYMHVSFVDLGSWSPPQPTASLKDWVTRWNAWSPDNTSNTEFWNQSDAFNPASVAAVLLPVSGAFDKVGFALGFEQDATEGSLRLLLKLQLDPGMPGARLASRSVFGVTDAEDPIGPLVRGPVSWACRPFGPVQSPHWVLDWEGLPTNRAHVELSANWLWSAMMRHYAVGLRSLREPNSLSFMPGTLAETKDKPVTSWTLRYLIDVVAGVPTSHLAELLPKAGSLQLRLPNVGTTANEPLLVDVSVKTASSRTRGDIKPGDAFQFLDLALAPTASAVKPQECLISGVLLPAGKAAKSHAGRASVLQASLRRPVKRVAGQHAMDVVLQLTLESALPRPGGQDAERDFESEDIWRQREPSIVWDLSGKPPSATIDIDETSRTGQSRRLLVQILPDLEVSDRADAIVLDAEPFLVARVLARSDAPQHEIFASYLDAPGTPGAWNFASETGELHLVLPPQAIGEEMIKGLFKIPDATGKLVAIPEAEKVFDHRLSPPAQLILKRTDINTARALAPWALRQLFDRRLGAVGARLMRARFELLYGLTSVLSDEDPENPLWLRLAEADALVGAIPLPSQLRDLVLSNDSAPPPLAAYANNVRDWIQSLLRRPAQLPVYREWTAREQLVIRDGLYFELRKTRQTANPFQPELPSQFFPQPRLPLRGGVDWGFESPNIYKDFCNSGSVLTNEERRKRGTFVPYGQISGLEFGALGGKGGQKAIFSNGKTHIISETTQGRLNSLTIVRIGRIAMTWNHARHVIVYERSTRTAPRYRKRPDDTDIADQQPEGFEGMSALRKVKEYIEVTQPRRAYPDYPTAVPSNAFLAGVFFETTVIPVKSSWGRDVPGGWVMHLRGPMTNAERPFYPEPKIFGELSRTLDKGGGHVNQPAEQIELLKFFTSTRTQDGADTDQWPAFPNVDVPLTARPKPPKVPFLSSFAGMARQPDAEPTDFGQRRFSLHLRPAEEAVNLMHGRPLKGLEARVRTISIARGAPAPLSALPDALGKVQVQCIDDRAVVVEALAEIASRVTQEAIATAGEATAPITGMRERLQQMADRTVALSDRANKAKLDTDPWTRQQGQLKALAETSASRLLESLSDALSKEAPEFWKNVWSESKGTAEAAQRIGQRIDVLQAQLRQQIQSQVSVAQTAVETFLSAKDQALSQAMTVAGATRTTWAADFSKVKVLFGTGAVVAADDAFRLALGALRAEVSKARDQVARQVSSWLGSFGDVVLSDGPGGPAALLTSAAQGALDMVLAYIDDALEYTPPFEGSEPDWSSLATLIPDEAALNTWFDDVTKSLADLSASLDAHWHDEREKVLKELDVVTQAARDRIKQILNGALGGDAGLRREVEDKLAGLIGEGGKRMAAVTQLLGNALPKDLADLGVVQDVSASLSDVGGNLRRLADLADRLPIADLEREIQGAVRDAEAALGQLADRVEREVVATLVNTAEGAIQPALEVTRAFAEGLVTDAIRCSRDWLGYYYDPNQLAVEVTRAAAIFNEMGQDTLNSLAAQMPFDRIRDRMLAQLADFDVNKLFPSFAGLQLEYLLGDLKVPPDPLAEYEWIKVKQGFNRDRLTAWADISIDKKFDGETEVFDLSPISLAVNEPHFTGHSRIGSPDGTGNASSTFASLEADWAVKVNNEPIMTIEEATLRFDQSGKLDFDFAPERVRLAPALEFITDALKALLPADSGLTLLPLMPGGVRAELCLPLPDIGTGAFTMTGITLNTYFELQVLNGFEVSTGLWLSKPDRPFGLAIVFLGGGGWFGVDVLYRPPSTFITRVSVGLSAGAFIALNLSVVTGSAGLLFTAGLDYYRDSSKVGGGDLAVTVGILVWGEFSVLGFISAYLRLVMRVEYRDGSMTGYGRVSVSIKICWCYTFRCDRPVAMPFAGGGGKSSAKAVALTEHTAAPAKTPEEKISTAVTRHLDSLSWT